MIQDGSSKNIKEIRFVYEVLIFPDQLSRGRKETELRILVTGRRCGSLG